MAVVHHARRHRRDVHGVTAAVMATTAASAYDDGPSKVRSPSHSCTRVTAAAVSAVSGRTSQNSGHRQGDADADAGEQPPPAVHHGEDTTHHDQTEAEQLTERRRRR